MTDLHKFSTFRANAFPRTRFFPDEGPLLETLEFFEISHGSYQSFIFLPYYCLRSILLFFIKYGITFTISTKI